MEPLMLVPLVATLIVLLVVLYHARKRRRVDLAMFARMLASNRSFHVDGAIQVAKAFTVNPKNYDPLFFRSSGECHEPKAPDDRKD